MRAQVRGVLLALGAAVLFGLVSVSGRASALPPLVLGGYAYLVAGILLAPSLRGFRVARPDAGRLLAMALVGGALAPALLFYGLARVGAADASILLTLEMVFTAVLAAVFLRERLPFRGWIGVAALFASAALLAAAGARAGETSLAGAALVLLAALGWGVDNTLSAKLAGSYEPRALVAIKGLVGGAAALLVALAIGASARLPLVEVKHVAYIGALGVAASIVLFYHALRDVGATLTASLFLPIGAIAGVVGAWLVLREPLAPAHAFAGALALAGAMLVVGAQREHA